MLHTNSHSLPKFVVFIFKLSIPEVSYNRRNTWNNIYYGFQARFKCLNRSIFPKMYYIYKSRVHLVLLHPKDNWKLILLPILTFEVILLKSHHFIYYLYMEYSRERLSVLA